MRSFAIEEPGSPVPALYATLPATNLPQAGTSTTIATLLCVMVDTAIIMIMIIVGKDRTGRG